MSTVIRMMACCWLLVLAGCANPVFRPQQPAVSGNAMLYLYRPEASTPGVMKPLLGSYPEVFVDGKSIGTIPYNRYLAIELSPGEHTIRLSGITEQARGWDMRDIERRVRVAAGSDQFLRLRVEYDLQKMNLLQPGSKYIILLTPVRKEDAIYEIRHVKPVR